MSETIVKGILLRASDYKDYDRLAKIFTLEEGLVSAVFKGVKRANAKLKFGCQQFAFCEFVLTQKSGRYTVTGCSAIEDFYGICLDADKFAVGSIILEMTEKSLYAEPNPELFILLLKSLKRLLLYDGAYVVGVYFAVKALQLLGYGGAYKVVGEVKSSSALIDKAALSDIDDLKDIPSEYAVTAMKRMAGIFEIKTDCQIKSKCMMGA